MSAPIAPIHSSVFWLNRSFDSGTKAKSRRFLQSRNYLSFQSVIGTRVCQKVHHEETEDRGESLATIHGPRQIAPGEELANLLESRRKRGSLVRARSQIARTREDFERFSVMSENRESGWWSRRDLNPRPLRCERSALPAELLPHPKETQLLL